MENEPKRKRRAIVLAESPWKGEFGELPTHARGDGLGFKGQRSN